MKTLYFSSTGNCLYIAKCLGGECLSVPELIDEGVYEIKDEEVGIVFPVYGLCIPPFIEEFLREIKIECNYLFAIATYGFFPGSICDEVSKITLANGRKFDYIKTIKMAENCITFADMEKQIGDSKKQQEAIDQIMSDISERLMFVKKESIFKRVLTNNHKKKYEYPTGTGITEEITINETCAGCGLCTRLCPMGNIHIEDGHPKFSQNCISCGACIQNCPMNAIHHCKEKSAVRYRNPHVEVNELIQDIAVRKGRE